MSYKEFVSCHSFTPEFLAGFRMYLRVHKQVEYMTEEGWKETLKEYQNRKI